ncbi:hypothetical protein [Taibaiella soli]|uniref:Uncharacterized protein n=1 Tax=Taibaiella soli TaxID=1649169 RepID=A0A2W2BLR4_9BACT|nr:hypothetical protein [Taibaiella soli]PZF74376.1 hypothetical protein DN068_02005 [Taibaiella soli]
MIKVAFFLLIGLLIKTQVQAQAKIEGLGRFKINKTSVALLDTLETEGFKRTIIHTRSEQRATELARHKTIAEVKPVTYASNPRVRISTCKDVKVFFIPFIEIDGFRVNDVYLVFYCNILAGIQADRSVKLVSVFESEYGKAPLVVEHKEHFCINPSAAVKKNYTHRAYTQRWRNNTILCVSSLGEPGIMIVPGVCSIM